MASSKWEKILKDQDTSIPTFVATDKGVDVIVSYATKSADDHGLQICAAICNYLEKQGITCFHGRMVKGGEDWQGVWFEQMVTAKIAILMMSPSFCKESAACKKEAVALCKQPHLEGFLIPILIDPMLIEGSMFGSSKRLKQQALIVMNSIGNLLPPPDEGCFPDNLSKNLELLKDRIQELLEEQRIESGDGIQQVQLHSTRAAIVSSLPTSSDGVSCPSQHFKDVDKIVKKNRNVILSYGGADDIGEIVVQEAARIRSGENHKGTKTLKGSSGYIGTYTGEMAAGKATGIGKWEHANGNLYEGEFKEDKMHGRGKFSRPDGHVYEGEWKDNKARGKGKCTMANGNVYVGEFKDDQLSGVGKYTFANGDLYEGEFKNDKMNGRGKLTRANGSIYNDGIWENDFPKI